MKQSDRNTLLIIPGKDIASIATRKLLILVILAFFPFLLLGVLIALRYGRGVVRIKEEWIGGLVFGLLYGIILFGFFKLLRSTSREAASEYPVLEEILRFKSKWQISLASGLAILVPSACILLSVFSVPTFLNSWIVYGTLAAWWAFLAILGLIWIPSESARIDIMTPVIVILALILVFGVMAVFSLPRYEARFVQFSVLGSSNQMRTATSDVLNQKLYERITAFLSYRIEAASMARETYWHYDFGSAESYSSGIEPYRQDFCRMIAVPEECLVGTMPIMVSDVYLTSIDGIEIRRWTLDVCDGELTSYALVGIPNDIEGPLPLVVAFHGTAGTPERIMGLDNIDDYHHQFGLKLAQQGYVVFAPRLITQSRGNLNQMRNELDNRGLSVGERLVGIEIGQTISAIDYLVTLDYVDSEHLATYGISLGGLMSFYLGALDERLKVVVVSQYIEDRTEKLTDQDYPDAYWRYENADYIFIPSRLKYFTDVDVASLIVPRKLFIEVGSQDVRRSGAFQVFLRIKAFYELLDQPSDSVQIGVGDGGHEIFLTDSLKFLNQWLKP